MAARATTTTRTTRSETRLRRSLWTLWLFLALANVHVVSLPFGTRGGSGNENEDGDKEEQGGGSDDLGKDESGAAKVKVVSLAQVESDGNTVTSNDASNLKKLLRVEDDTEGFRVWKDFFAGKDEDDLSGNATLSLREDLGRHAKTLESFLVETRRALHRIPELMYQEEMTSRMVKDTLEKLGIFDYTEGWSVNTRTQRIPGRGGYGITVDIGTKTQPCVLLRADMDALPILERTEHIEDFKSQSAGRMHACGHDGHTTMLLGATAILKYYEDQLPGTVRIVFQPAEEGGAGAKRFIEEGLLDMEPKPQRAFGIHVWPTLPSGTVASRPGPLLAATDFFEILIAGVGGHAAMPHLTVDPVVAAASVITNLQTIVSRTLSPLDSGVVSVASVHTVGNEAFNVIPASISLRGTFRALTVPALLELKSRIEFITHQTAAAMGCNATLTFMPDFSPTTVNDEHLFHQVAPTVAQWVAPDQTLHVVEPTMGGEDFAFYSHKIPSLFFLLGQGSGQDPPTNYGLHHPHFALDESVLPMGVQIHLSAALLSLRSLSQTDPANATAA